MAFVTTILKVLVVLCITITIPSCGLFQNHRKIVDLPIEGEESQGRMVILKAQDRISYGKEFGAFCSEPSPDAISALASSNSASALIDAGRKADLAIALQQSNSSIGASALSRFSSCVTPSTAPVKHFTAGHLANRCITIYTSVTKIT